MKRATLLFALIASSPMAEDWAIGPVTTQTARALGIAVTAQARTYTIDGLVELSWKCSARLRRVDCAAQSGCFSTAAQPGQNSEPGRQHAEARRFGSRPEVERGGYEHVAGPAERGDPEDYGFI
jgi:hypothetical protein